MESLAPPEALGVPEAVLRFLASVGPSSEAEFYLRLYRSRAAESFATIAVEADAVQQNIHGVAADLRFLRALGLTPVVIIGLDQPESAEASRGALLTLLQDAGIETASLPASASLDAVASAAQAGKIPLLTATEASAADRLDELARLLTNLKTHKLVFLSPRGGLRSHGELLSVVNLSTDYAALHASTAIDARHRQLLENSRRLVLDLVPHSLLVNLTSPFNLLRELFTVKGAGTLLRRGAGIVRHDGYSGIDLSSLQGLLTASFGHAPNADLFRRPVERVYVEQSYRGAALVTTAPLAAYLSKFAVTREAQGEGIGQDLWNALVADYPALFWRARNENPVRAWYERQCHGRFQAGLFTVYMRGIKAQEISSAIAFALAQPIDF